MRDTGIHITELPELNHPILIAGFDGWGNALNVSKGMVTYLIEKLDARPFARLNPDVFYRFDEARPLVNIEDGDIKSLSPPGGSFYAMKTDGGGGDVVILRADEPNLRWYQFVDELFVLCGKLGIETLITLGSMYDNVLHTDRVISGLSSNEIISQKLKEKNISTVSYQGPSAIHSLINSEGPERETTCISLWSHCPYYLQGTTHYGLLSHLGALLADLGGFQLDTNDLNESWQELNEQIQKLIDASPELHSAIQELRKQKVKGSWANMKESLKKDDKVINLKDFMDPK